MITETRPLSVRDAVISSINARYEGGRLPRPMWLNRQSIADEAVEALGETVPDTAVGSAHLQAWVRLKLDAKPA